MARDQERFWDKVNKQGDGGCWLWTGATANGYGYFRLGCKVVPAHRVAYVWLRGDIPDGMDLDHLCRCRCCVNPSHLEPVSRSENTKRGRTGKTHFTRAEIDEIRRLYETGDYSQYELAGMFGTCQGHVSNIIRRVIWDHPYDVDAGPLITLREDTMTVDMVTRILEETL